MCITDILMQGPIFIQVMADDGLAKTPDFFEMGLIPGGASSTTWLTVVVVSICLVVTIVLVLGIIARYSMGSVRHALEAGEQSPHPPGSW